MEGTEQGLLKAKPKFGLAQTGCLDSLYATATCFRLARLRVTAKATHQM